MSPSAASANGGAQAKEQLRFPGKRSTAGLHAGAQIRFLSAPHGRSRIMPRMRNFWWPAVQELRGNDEKAFNEYQKMFEISQEQQAEGGLAAAVSDRAAISKPGSGSNCGGKIPFLPNMEKTAGLFEDREERAVQRHRAPGAIADRRGVMRRINLIRKQSQLMSARRIGITTGPSSRRMRCIGRGSSIPNKPRRQSMIRTPQVRPSRCSRI